MASSLSIVALRHAMAGRGPAIAITIARRASQTRRLVDILLLPHATSGADVGGPSLDVLPGKCIPLRVSEASRILQPTEVRENVGELRVGKRNRVHLSTTATDRLG